MSDIQKYVETAKNIEFCDDFGKEPVLLARVTKDASTIVVLSLIGGFVAMAAMGFPGLVAVAFAALNDISYARSRDDEDDTKSPTVINEVVIDVESSTVENQTQQGIQRSGEVENNPIMTRAKSETQLQPEFQPFDNPIMTRAKGETLGISGIQPVGIAQDATTMAAAPSYGVSKVLSPLDRILASPYQSRAWFGAQRTGKSYLAAIASQQMNKIKGTQVFHINLYSFGDEDDAYFVHAVMSVRGDLTHLSGHEAQSLITKAYNVVTAFKKVKDAILIVDEITMMGATSSAHKEAVLPLMQEIAALGSVLASTGKKRKQALWTLSPDFVAGSLTQEAKSIKSLTISFVAIPPGTSLDWEGQAIGFHAESFTNVQRNFPALSDAPFMDCDRMVFLDGLWLDMGTLPDLIAKEPIEDWRETFAKSLPAKLSEPEFKQRYELERMLRESSLETTYQSQSVPDIEVEPVHPLQDKFDRIENLLKGQDSIGIRDISRTFTCKSDEASQLAQMFCLSQKSRFKFSQVTKPNGTVSKSIERV